MPEYTIRASFAAQIREGLAEYLLKLEQADEAQKWMLEAADIREKNRLGRNALFAGQVQGYKGDPVIQTMRDVGPDAVAFLAHQIKRCS